MGSPGLIAFRVASALAFVGFLGCSGSSQPSENAASPTPQVRSVAAPYTRRHIYSETADPKADIAAALQQAKHEHKRVLIDFGGDWCGDCQVLHIYFDQSPNKEILDKSFIVVNVFVDSQIDNHLDIGQKYGIPLKKGVPAIAVLDANGKVLYSPQNRESEAMSRTDAQSVTDFLNRWKA